MTSGEIAAARAEIYHQYRIDKNNLVLAHKKALHELHLAMRQRITSLAQRKIVRPVGRPPTTSEGPFYGTPRRGAHSPPARPETNKELYARMTEADKEKMRKYGGNPDDLLKEEDDKEDPNDAYMRKHGIDPDASAQS